MFSLAAVESCAVTEKGGSDNTADSWTGDRQRHEKGCLRVFQLTKVVK